MGKFQVPYRQKTREEKEKKGTIWAFRFISVCVIGVLLYLSR